MSTMYEVSPTFVQSPQTCIENESCVKQSNGNNEEIKFAEVILKEEPAENMQCESGLPSPSMVLKTEVSEFRLGLEDFPVLANQFFLKGDEKLFCSECGASYKVKHNLMIHFRKVHNPKLEVTMYKCTDCDFEAVRKITLQRHIEQLHTTKDTLYKCNSCKYETYIESNLKQHIYRRHNGTRKGKIHYCTFCSFQTYYTDNLKKHVRVQHIKDDLQKCKICGFETYYKNHLSTHIVTKHQKTILYKCEHCEYESYSKIAHQSHVKTKHLKLDTELKKCDICGFETHCRKSYTDHLKRMHWKTLKKVYSCNLCEYETGLKGALTEHKERAHSELFELLRCTLCTYQTTVRRDFAMHKRKRHKNKQPKFNNEYAENKNINTELMEKDETIEAESAKNIDE